MAGMPCPLTEFFCIVYLPISKGEVRSRFVRPGGLAHAGRAPPYAAAWAYAPQPSGRHPACQIAARLLKSLISAPCFGQWLVCRGHPI